MLSITCQEEYDYSHLFENDFFMDAVTETKHAAGISGTPNRRRIDPPASACASVTGPARRFRRPLPADRILPEISGPALCVGSTSFLNGDPTARILRETRLLVSWKFSCNLALILISISAAPSEIGNRRWRTRTAWRKNCDRRGDDSWKQLITEGNAIENQPAPPGGDFHLPALEKRQGTSVCLRSVSAACSTLRNSRAGTPHEGSAQVGGDGRAHRPSFSILSAALAVACLRGRDPHQAPKDPADLATSPFLPSLSDSGTAPCPGTAAL